MPMYQALLVRLGKALDSAGIPYMLIGGQAVLLWLGSYRDVVHRGLLDQFRDLKRQQESKRMP